jgi:hypothetical protein
MRKRWAATFGSESVRNEKVCDVPTRVRNNNRTTGGPNSGKITANVLAKATANTQQDIANNGLYVLGYVATAKVRNCILLTDER